MHGKPYRASNVPPGLRPTSCLYFVSETVASVLDSPLPTRSSEADRANAPFVVSVLADADRNVDGENRFPGYFRVTLESIMDDFFLAIADQSPSPVEIKGDPRGRDAWINLRGS